MNAAELLSAVASAHSAANGFAVEKMAAGSLFVEQAGFWPGMQNVAVALTVRLWP